jgi:hypothetical protein
MILSGKRKIPEQASFYILLISQFIATTGFTFVMPFMPIYVRQLGVHDVGTAAAWAGFINGASRPCGGGWRTGSDARPCCCGRRSPGRS